MTEEDAIREAFSRIKQDILELKQEISLLKQEIYAIKQDKLENPTDLQQIAITEERPQHINQGDKPIS